MLVALGSDLRSATVLAREGEGPAEYHQPDAVWPLPGDSTLLVDLGNGRLTVVAPDGCEAWVRGMACGAHDRTGRSRDVLEKCDNRRG